MPIYFGTSQDIHAWLAGAIHVAGIAVVYLLMGCRNEFGMTGWFDFTGPFAPRV
jgi:hypothetical protein